MGSQKVEGSLKGRKYQLRLTERDRALCGVLATVRILSTDQIGRLMFPARNEKNLLKRLLALSTGGENGSLLERLPYRTFNGERLSAWRLTSQGYCIAERVLEERVRLATTKTDLGAYFLDHTIGTNELYVRLLEAPLLKRLHELHAIAAAKPQPAAAFARMKAPVFASPTTPGVRWIAGNMVRLPWKELDNQERPHIVERAISPDAVLELPGLKRRVFIEFETGSHSIQTITDDKQGSTIAKVRRYFNYVLGYTSTRFDSTNYSVQFPDGFQPELVFLTTTRSRAQTIRDALLARKSDFGDRRLPLRANTVEDEAHELLKVLGVPELKPLPQPPPRPTGPTLTSAQLRLMHEFVYDAVATIKAQRADARMRQAPVPEYPKTTDLVWELIGALTLKRGA